MDENLLFIVVNRLCDVWFFGKIFEPPFVSNVIVQRDTVAIEKPFTVAEQVSLHPSVECGDIHRHLDDSVEPESHSKWFLLHVTPTSHEDDLSESVCLHRVSSYQLRSVFFVSVCVAIGEDLLNRDQHIFRALNLCNDLSTTKICLLTCDCKRDKQEKLKHTIEDCAVCSSLIVYCFLLWFCFSGIVIVRFKSFQFVLYVYIMKLWWCEFYQISIHIPLKSVWL